MQNINRKSSKFYPLKYWLATGFGSGKLPIAPGTFGTLIAVPLVIFLDCLPVFLQVIFIILSYFIGVKICDAVAKQINKPDPSEIVWDEMVGFMITMLVIPLSFWSLLIGFVVFRFFDILKPFPIGYLDKKIKGGQGIMLDDVVAGIFSWLVLQTIMSSGWYF